MSDKEIRRKERFSEEGVQLLTEEFLGPSSETRGGALTNKEKIRTFLRYIGDPGFQIGVGEDVGVHQSTVSRVVQQVSAEIASQSKNWIIFPHTVEEILEAQRLCSSKYEFPCAIGALDCTHVRIRKPLTYHEEYINRKGYYSINVQASCNAEEKFTSVEVCWPGSVHDSRILLGDEGYGITPWLMTPFKETNNDIKRNFNAVLTKERVIIERCFGQIKQRFPILQYKVRVKQETIPNLIASCFILHNFAKYLHEDEIVDESNQIITKQRKEL
ncbi:putative nuclease HARBI1 [Eupeodes corollae]|uniref:putative nuclease HARBI1 n=1 Tax=Eupeodes corollae TaxID=290404 RepID=UPI0024901658|nr:putative nuclease HARBI1 [Eupeodes corollae]